MILSLAYAAGCDFLIFPIKVISKISVLVRQGNVRVTVFL